MTRGHLLQEVGGESGEGRVMRMGLKASGKQCGDPQARRTPSLTSAHGKGLT